MRRLAIVFLLLCAALPWSAAAAGSSPTDAVTANYKMYAGPKGDYETGSIDDKRVAAYFTKSLRHALAATNSRSRKLNEPILDFDPVTNPQRLSIASENQGGVAATFFSGESGHVVRYAFKSEGGAPKIDDISGGSGAGARDLRRIIAPEKK
jgi:hypothetical protein